MRILVTGSRHWTDEAFIEQALVSALKQSGMPAQSVTVVHGACHLGGADIIAGRVALRLGMKVEPHQANWPEHGKRAGPIRNGEMVKLGAALCLAFSLPGSRGTADCVRQATAAGIPVHVFVTGNGR